MENKYGNYTSKTAIKTYCNALVGRIYKLLPMREDTAHPDAWKQEYNKLMRELSSGNEYLKDNGMFCRLIFKLEGADKLEHVPFNSEFRKTILESIDIVKKILDDVDRGKYDD